MSMLKQNISKILKLIFSISENYHLRVITIMGIRIKHRRPGIKYSIYDHGQNNSVIVNDDFVGEILIEGDNNKIDFTNLKIINSLTKIYGNNHNVKFNKSCIQKFSIDIGNNSNQPDNCIIEIGENTSMVNAVFLLFETNSKISIGKNCLISFDVELRNSDMHTVINSKKEVLNTGKSIEIGDHVWIARDVTIGKNTKIPSNCIVGQGAVVTKQFEEENCVIAGNPAKICKRGINWDGRPVDIYIKENSNNIISKTLVGRERERERERE